MSWPLVEKALPWVFATFIALDMFFSSNGSFMYAYIKSFLLSFTPSQYLFSLIMFFFFLSYRYYVRRSYGKVIAMMLGVYVCVNAFIILIDAIYFTLLKGWEYVDKKSYFSPLTIIVLALMPSFFVSTGVSWSKSIFMCLLSFVAAVLGSL